MRISLIIWIILVSSLAANAQTQSGKVTYHYKAPEKFTSFVDTSRQAVQQAGVKSFFKRKYRQLKIAGPYFRFYLKFTPTEALFYHQKGMTNDNNMNLNSLISLFTGAGDLYYTNLDEKIGLRQIGDSDAKIIIKELGVLNWKIVPGKKEILGYSCHKAIATLNFYNGITQHYTAWFAPQLPYQFGPAGLSGLPGLILGLKTNHGYVYATALEFFNEPLIISRPQSKQMVSRKIHLKKAREAYQKTKHF